MNISHVMLNMTMSISQASDMLSKLALVYLCKYQYKSYDYSIDRATIA